MSLRTITRHYASPSGSGNATGRVTFRPHQPIELADTTYVRTAISEDLDGSGDLSITVPATTDSLTPDAWYEVREDIDGDAHGPWRFYVQVPAGVGSIDISTLPRRIPPPAVMFGVQGSKGDPGNGLMVHGSMSALRTAATPDEGTVVELAGYYGDGDGGGGRFIWRSGSSAAHNGGTVIQPDGVTGNGRYLRLGLGEGIRGRFAWFGAKGRRGGATTAPTNSDHAALQAAHYSGLTDFWLDDYYPTHAPIDRNGVTWWGADPDRAGIDGSAIAGTIADTSVPGQTINVSAVLWSSGYVTELTGFVGCRAGENVITIADTTGLKKGDVLCFSNETPYSFSGSRDYYRLGFFAVVHNLNSGFDVRLADPAPYDMDPADDIHVYVVTPTRGTLNDIGILSAPGYSGYHEKWGYRNVHRNVWINGSDTHNGWMDRCYRCDLVNPHVQDHSDVGLAQGQTGGTNYGWLWGNSQELTMLGGNLETGRHGLTTGGDTTKCAINCRDMKAIGVTLGSERDTSFFTAGTTTPVPTGAPVVTTTTAGKPAQNATIIIDARAVGVLGSFALTKDAQTASGLSGGISARALQSALAALPTVGAGNVTVYGGTADTSPFVVIFGGALAHTAVTVTTTSAGVAISTLVAGGVAASEVQRIDATTATTGITAGQYVFAFRGRVTTPVAFNAAAATLQAALEALPSIGTGGVALTGGPLNSGTVDVAYAGPLANTNVEPLHCYATVGITTITPGVAGTHEVWQVDARGVTIAHTFQLIYGGQTTREIGGNAVSATVQAALEALPNVGPGNMLVTTPLVTDGADDAVLTITPRGALAYQNLTAPTASATGGAPAPTVATITNGAAGTNEVQRIDARAIGAGGAFELLVAGQYTGGIAGNATAATIQAALELLGNVGPGGATVTVTSGDVGTTADQVRFDATFTGRNGSRNMPRIEGGVMQIQTPFSGSNHGNIDGMDWVGCTFKNGCSSGGRRVRFLDCHSRGNMESGVAYLFGEMLAGDVIIDGGTVEAQTNIASAAGLIHFTMPPSCDEGGTIQVRNLGIDMHGYRAVSGITSAIFIDNDAFDPYGPHAPFTPVAQQDMDVSIANVVVESNYPTTEQMPAYWLNISSSASVASKGFRKVVIDDVTTTGMGARLYNNDPWRLSIHDYHCYEAREYGLYVMANRATSKYANSKHELKDCEIEGSYSQNVYMVGANNGADSATTPVDKLLVVHDSTLLNGTDRLRAGTTAAPSTNFQGNYYVAGYVDVDWKHNECGQAYTAPQNYSDGGGGATRSRVGTFDLITTLRHHFTTHVGSITAENIGAGVGTFLLDRRAAGAPTVACANSSMFYRTDGTTGSTVYARVAGAWAPIA